MVTLLKRFWAWLSAEVVMDEPKPAARIPGPPVEDTAESRALEAEARLTHAAHRIEQELYAQTSKSVRNGELIDLLLDLRAVVRPAPAEAQLLREVPPVEHRFPFPVVRGGAQ